MAITGDAQARIDSYLSKLRVNLEGLPQEQVWEIAEELRSHITEKASARGDTSAEAVDGVLAALGKPQDLAREYMTGAVLARVEASHSPLRILGTFYRWARLSIAGFFALLGLLLGYGTGIAFFLTAALKPFHPQKAGLWIWRDAGDLFYSMRLGFGDPPPGARELLGWWLVPIGLAVSCAVVVSTTHFATWCVRRYHRSRMSRQIPASAISEV